jgi:hypothetical protein
MQWPMILAPTLKKIFSACACDAISNEYPATPMKLPNGI